MWIKNVSNITNNPASLLRLEIILSLVGISLLIIGSGCLFAVLHYFDDKFLPGTQIDGLEVGGLTHAEALTTLSRHQSLPDIGLTLQFEDQALSSSSAQLQLRRNFEAAIAEAQQTSGALPWWDKVLAATAIKKTAVSTNSQLAYDGIALQIFLSEFAKKVELSPTPPQAELKISNSPKSLVLDPGKPGKELPLPETQTLIEAALKRQSSSNELKLTAQVATVGAQLAETELETSRQRALQFVGKKITFEGSDQRLHLSDQDLVRLLAFPQGFSQEKIGNQISEWHQQIGRPPQDAEFEYDPQTLKVTKFVPHRDGLELDQSTTRETLLTALNSAETASASTNLTYPLSLKVSQPQKPLSATNDLGINEVIGLGESEYDHSIPSRIHNVSLTSSKITNHIVKPGEEFSFNKTLGDVSAATGFKPAYVIKDGQTVLGDGGGVCQVSTTLFRALLDGGLKITRRRPHSYRVTYYELNSKPGVDATVYSGEVDLRFVNDTDHHILIHSEADSKNLYMKVELYGTSDGRTAEIVDHVTWDARPAPATVYIPDPTLPPGTKKQIDWAASGIRAKFRNIIKDKNGQVIREDEYVSNYQPWSAKYLVGL